MRLKGLDYDNFPDFLSNEKVVYYYINVAN